MFGSVSNKSLKKTGHTRSIKNLVIHQAKLAKSAGLDGIVCSAKEAKLIRKKYQSKYTNKLSSANCL